MIRPILFLTLVLAVSTSKVDPLLKESLRKTGPANIFIEIQGGTEDVIRSFETVQNGTRTDKITSLVTNLQKQMENTQKYIARFLKSNSADYKQFWINNQIFVKGASAELVAALEAFPEVTHIRHELVAHLDISEGELQQNPVEWNIEQVEANQAWTMPGGNSGGGIVIASNEAGVRHTHETISGNFRQDYGWYDPYDGTGEPSDTIGIGTQTIGTAVGKGGIGVAPGAEWIACRACSGVSCSEYSIISCGQWIACPTLVDGTQPDCSRAPRVAISSWGGGNDFFQQVLTIWRNAGIIPIFPVGNSGPVCGTAISPNGVIAVGATTQQGTIASFSGRGPVEGIVKPDIVAPGLNVKSATHSSDTSYISGAGTSTGAAHVAGAVAIVLSENPNLTYAQVKQVLEDNTDQNLPDMGVQCGSPTSSYPNNVYGYGRLNVRKALEAVM